MKLEHERTNKLYGILNIKDQNIKTKNKQALSMKKMKKEQRKGKIIKIK